MASLPTIDKYNEAVQYPALAFSDKSLRTGKVLTNGFGIPIALGGGFALTYTIVNNGSKFAIRCFHKSSSDIEKRYTLTGKFFSGIKSNFFVGFEYQAQGILVGGNRFPIVKMDWIDGDTLGSYIESSYSDKQLIGDLLLKFRVLEAFLTNQSIAHGDLQNGNVIVNGTGIKLIDYDGIFVPGMQEGKGTEVGHKHFQHPKRTALTFGPKIDRFSLIVIDLSLRALLERPSLFDKYSNGENILFTASDFFSPGKSNLFSELKSINSLEKDINCFANICTAGADSVPSLSNFLSGHNIPSGLIHISTNISNTVQSQVYISAFDVFSALDFEGINKRVGDKIELIGEILNVKEGIGLNRKPFVFINFGDWRGQAVKINIWSEGIAKMTSRPGSTWVGKWISVNGLVDQPYSNAKYGYTHLSITITDPNQLRIIDKVEAKRRLGSNQPDGAPSQITSNEHLLGYIRGNTIIQSSSSGNQSIPHGIRTPNNRDILTLISGQTSKHSVNVPVPPPSQAPTSIIQNPPISPVPPPPSKDYQIYFVLGIIAGILIILFLTNR